MRKIEQQMLAAIQQRRNWKNGNTQVQFNSDTKAIRVTLYQTVIAETCISPDTGNRLVRFCAAGWQTPTTKSRLQMLMHELLSPHSGIQQQKGKWLVRLGDVVCDWQDIEGNWLAAA